MNEGSTASGESQSDRSVVFIGLGSNLGDRMDYLRRALRAVDALEQTGVVSCSPIYATEPRIVEDQPDFLNACAKIETALPPDKLLAQLLDVEESLGRVRRRDKGARTVDLDILLWEDRIVDHDALTIPHPGLPDRAFVLVPLEAIAAEVRDPRSGQTITQLRRACPDTGTIERYADAPNYS